ncbi:hypothetical protein [Arthrobacter sp. 2MCAF14]|uniref:hypothetical protein n=1 Tax=Arthrobacter sp. 2MCAF14 TaxID=3232982 RepID=UPI003F8E93DB
MTTTSLAYVHMTLQETAAAVHVTYGNARSRMNRIAHGENARCGFPEPREKIGGAYLFDAKDVARFIKDHGITEPAH